MNSAVEAFTFELGFLVLADAVLLHHQLAEFGRVPLVEKAGLALWIHAQLALAVALDGPPDWVQYGAWAEYVDSGPAPLVGVQNEPLQQNRFTPTAGADTQRSHRELGQVIPKLALLVLVLYRLCGLYL